MDGSTFWTRPRYVADQGTMRIAVDVVLDQDVVLEYRDLRKIVALPDDHLARHRFAPGEELGLAQHGRATPTCLPTFASTLPLGLHPSRPVDAGDFIADVLPAGSRTRTRVSVGSSGAGAASSSGGDDGAGAGPRWCVGAAICLPVSSSSGLLCFR